MSRAMMITVLYRLAGNRMFRVWNARFGMWLGSWYAVRFAGRLLTKLRLGVSGEHFNPSGTLTREQMAVLLYRYAKLQKADTATTSELTDFPDGASVSSWAKDAMQWAVGTGLICGIRKMASCSWIRGATHPCPGCGDPDALSGRGCIGKAGLQRQ